MERSATRGSRMTLKNSDTDDGMYIILAEGQGSASVKFAPPLLV